MHTKSPGLTVIVILINSTSALISVVGTSQYQFIIYYFIPVRGMRCSSLGEDICNGRKSIGKRFIFYYEIPSLCSVVVIASPAVIIFRRPRLVICYLFILTDVHVFHLFSDENFHADPLTYSYSSVFIYILNDSAVTSI